MQGALVATIGIVASKILGMIYVIPFHAIIGEQGGALYGYAYNIYSIFLSISTAGIPLAISSMTSEYNTLGYNNTKERIFKIARKYLSIVGIACFIVLFLFAKDIAYLILGEVSGGNTIEDVTFVIRVISFSILIVPTLSVYRGYLQGHKYITPTTISQILEQLIRVTIIIVGSYIITAVFKLPIKFAVSSALFGATIGALFSLLYLVHIRKKFAHEINTEAEIMEEEKKITDKMIMKNIIICAFPFIFCDVCKSLYNSVDTFFVVKTLVKLGYDTNIAETVMSVISTWGNKLNMIVIAIGTGFAVSLIPNLAAAIIKRDMEDAQSKINKTFQIIFFLIVPMALGLSFLSIPVWNIFYGSSEYGPIVFRFSIMVSIVTVLLSTTQVIGLSLKEYKILFISVALGLMINACLDVPLMYLFEKFSYGFYGAIASTCLGHLSTVIIVLNYLRKKHNLKFGQIIKTGIRSIIISIIMIAVLKIISLWIPLEVSSRLLSLVVLVFYVTIGLIIYLGLSYKLKVIEQIFSKQDIEKVKNKLKIFGKVKV